jgi:hypothetical protein
MNLIKSYRQGVKVVVSVSQQEGENRYTIYITDGVFGFASDYYLTKEVPVINKSPEDIIDYIINNAVREFTPLTTNSHIKERLWKTWHQNK